MTETIRVNFGRPLPVFPLAETVLLPHAIQHLHVFEPRYRQMIGDVLDGPGQIAMACYVHAEHACCVEVDGAPLRPAVCVGHILQHEELPDGRFNVLLHGICRARILKVIEPDDERLYRMARIEPIELPRDEQPAMNEVRSDLRKLLTGPRLRRLRSVETVMNWFEREDVSTPALLELIGFVLLRDVELKYRLLAEASPVRRANLITGELQSLDDLVSRADRQDYKSWPKGMSWN